MFPIPKKGRAMGAALVLLLVPMFASPPRADAASFVLECRRTLQAGYAAWVRKTLKLSLRCHRDVMRGRLASTVDCVDGGGDFDLALRLRSADERLRLKLASGCNGASWTLLSFPGPCPEPLVPPFDSDDAAYCAVRETRARFDELIPNWRPLAPGPATGSEAGCLGTIPRRAAAMLEGEVRARLECLLEQERAGGESSVDCRAQLPPYGVGTGDAVLDARIADAHRQWLQGMPADCSLVDFGALALGSRCEGSSSASPLLDFQACVTRENREAAARMTDYVFPSAAVCGNGIQQEGEACDDGPANSDTVGDACREDCSLPICGDGTRDGGFDEQCDDGNQALLDGCTPACIAEVCGDGITNNLPAEQCDDGNTVASDPCTGTCRTATCGDAVVCTDPSCTSGPGGGPERCDLGAANAADGLCKPDCSGYSRSCVLTVGVTNTVLLGSITYEMGYGSADGEVLGSGGSVQCTSSVTGGLVSFFDNEVRKTVKESLIVDAGVNTPAALATCRFATNDAGLAGSDFTFVVQAATDTAFQPVTANLAVTAISCGP